MAIVLDNITVSYRSVPAVHHAYARFEPGSSWAIFGPNGAGKSTLLKAVMRLLPCDTGSVQWQGLQRRDLAYLPQQAEIDRSLPMTVAELTALGLWHELGAFGGIRRAQRARVLQALEQVGMAAFAQRQIAALSRGQFQRVLFARMLVQDARFLLLDEPFNAMDAYTTQSLLMLLRQCQQQGKGIIAVVHDAAQARQWFDQALLLAREVMACGPAQQVLSDANLQRASSFRQDAATDDEWCRVQPEQIGHGHVHDHDHDHDHAHAHGDRP